MLSIELRHVQQTSIICGYGWRDFSEGGAILAAMFSTICDSCELLLYCRSAKYKLLCCHNSSAHPSGKTISNCTVDGQKQK